MYIILVCKWQCLYPQDCILIWIYRTQINYITITRKGAVPSHVLCTRSNDDIFLKKYYKQYCKILANVIKETKKYTYNTQINKPTNKIKTTWNIIKKKTNRHKRLTAITDYRNSPEAFNIYVLTISENIIKTIRSNKQNHDTHNSPNYYLSNQPHRAFPNIKFIKIHQLGNWEHY